MGQAYARSAAARSSVRPVLGALWRAVRRDLATFASIKVNNFFLFVALIIYGALVSGVKPVASYPFLLLLGFLLLFPLAADPLAKIPRSRLGLWPLDRAQRAVLRAASLAFSPMLWLAAALILRTTRSAWALGLLAIPVVTHGLARPHWRPLGRIGIFPELVRKNVRQMLTVLDTWVAILLAAGGTIARVRAIPGAATGMAILVAIALSTWTQCLFSLDEQGGVTRYRVLPLPGWRILAAKDAAFLGILLLLTLPLDPFAGLAFGLAALAVGRYPAIRLRLPVERWRFTSGRVLFGVLQAGLGAAAAEHVAAGLPLAAGLWLLSLWLGGKSLFRDSGVRK
jgi:hypothetical protein